MISKYGTFDLFQLLWTQLIRQMSLEFFHLSQKNLTRTFKLNMTPIPNDPETSRHKKHGYKIIKVTVFLWLLFVPLYYGFAIAWAIKRLASIRAEHRFLKAVWNDNTPSRFTCRMTKTNSLVHHLSSSYSSCVCDAHYYSGTGRVLASIKHWLNTERWWRHDRSSFLNNQLKHL